MFKLGLFDFVKKLTSKEGQKFKYAPMLNGYMPIFSQFGQDIYASDVVQQAVNCIVREMKKLDPQHVIKKGSNVTPIEDEIQAVLDNPNDLMTTSDLIEKMVWNLMFNYNSFVLPEWDKHSGKLVALYPLQPTQVDFLQDASGTMFIKMTFANDYKSTVRYSDVIHIRYNYANNEFMGGNASGQPDHQALLETLKLNDTLMQGVAKALKSSFAINGVIKYNTMLDQDKTLKAVEELTQALKNNESGLMPLDLKGEFIPFQRQIAMVDEATLRFIDEKILRHFGVSIPILTGDYTKEQYEAFYQKTLEPLIKSIGQAFTKAMFTRRESIGFGHRIMFYPKDLIFLNTTQKLEMIRMLGDSGALFENEKRVLLGLKPIAELDGVRKQSLNYVDVEIANEYQTKGQTTDNVEPEEPVKEEGVEDEEAQ
ncbi:MAG: phage portal protein [Bacteroidales bacterium]|nr:phage portal protein [Bacteroidales bacterium]